MAAREKFSEVRALEALERASLAIDRIACVMEKEQQDRAAMNEVLFKLALPVFAKMASEAFGSPERGHFLDDDEEC